MKQHSRPLRLRGLILVWPNETLLSTRLGGWSISEADRISPWGYRPDDIAILREVHADHKDGLLTGAELFCARLEGHALRGAALFMNPRALEYDAVTFWGHLHRTETVARWERALHARAHNQVRS